MPAKKNKFDSKPLHFQSWKFTEVHTCTRVKNIVLKAMSNLLMSHHSWTLTKWQNVSKFKWPYTDLFLKDN